MSSKCYQITGATPDDLLALFFRDRNGLDCQTIRDKPQVKFLQKYCTDHNIKHLLYEYRYVDQFFSQDFSGYYARPFARYDKYCSRIHFFTGTVTETVFEQLLTSPIDLKALDNLGYCGFVVVKPLPNTIIGRTCLVPAPLLPRSTNEPVPTDPAPPDPVRTDLVPTLQSIKANLFGLPLTVRSLPFQEQDREVAACATSALWTTLYASSFRHQHRLLSPLQITKLAFDSLPTLARSLPNDGLEIDHMASVIRSMGLECELVKVGGEQSMPSIQSYIAAYLRSGLPIVLSFDFTPPPERPAFHEFDAEELGTGGEDNPSKYIPKLHAVAVTGYRLNDGEPEADTKSGFKLRATRIDRLYVHDDRVGPFSPVDFIEGSTAVTTGWKNDDEHLPAYPVSLTIPISRQVRIPYSLIQEAVSQFDASLGAVIERQKAFEGVTTRPEWDIYLVEINGVRDSIRDDPTVSDEEKIDVLTTSMPHFMWRAVGYINGDSEIDLLFDATDLRQGKVLIRSIRHSSSVYAALQAATANIPPSQIKISGKETSPLYLTIVTHFADRPAEPTIAVAQ